MTTPREVAEWMLQKVLKDGEIYQDVVVYEIEEDFGAEFVYDNENGNLAVDRQVLSEFRKLSSKTVVWERGNRLWRLRESFDEPGRQQY